MSQKLALIPFCMPTIFAAIEHPVEIAKVAE
jgi:hypothetical protein